MEFLVSLVPSSVVSDRALRASAAVVAVCGGAAALVSAALTARSWYSQSSARSARAARLAAMDKESRTVVLWQFPVAKGGEPAGQPLSVPCARVEMYLKMKKIPYVVKTTMDPAAASPDTERLPVIEYRGRAIEDSKFIIEFLEQEFGNVAADLGAEAQRDISFLLSMSQTLMNHFYRSFYIDNPESAIELYTTKVAPEYPAIAIKQYLSGRRKTMIKTWNAMGHGDYTIPQYTALFLEDIKALETFFAGRAWALGAEPSRADCFIAPTLAYIKWTGANVPSLAAAVPAVKYIVESKVLGEYLARVDKACAAGAPAAAPAAASTSAADTKKTA